MADFDKGWRFHLGDVSHAEQPAAADKSWRILNLPHDWSIEGTFSKDNPATPEGGALPGGIGWYRKTFTVPAASKGKQIYIDFDGVYQHSDVWINGQHLGFRSNGYISFRYDLTPYLNFGGSNTIAVKVNNAEQPNSRWYSGSGIYRNVWLVTTAKIAIDHWGTYVTTPQVSKEQAEIAVELKVKNAGMANANISTHVYVYDAAGKLIAGGGSIPAGNTADTLTALKTKLIVKNPRLWSVDDPYLYRVVSKVFSGNKEVDAYTANLGIRYFNFDADKGFSLNGKAMKILGVCNHHDLGSLGSAINTRALERQLQILKAMGCNGIRTSHNPPAPELLDLCDRMGFIVMDEAFDMWKLEKTKYDYHLFWDEWHKRDLQDQLLRDRNHPSVFIWSIGNEIGEQYSKTDTSGRNIARELAGIVRAMDNRPITSANNDPSRTSNIIASGALDLIGYNYHEFDYAKFHERFPGKKFIATETTSGLETRGYYEFPSDSIRVWPRTWDKPNVREGNRVSAFDNVRPPWGSTHEATWKVMKKHDYLSGMYIWTGFDYLGEPTPYSWPSRSSYFGIVDLAGFPKDVYYMYQSEWTDKPVLHLFPHWNWAPGQMVDLWAYYNNADEVELYLNGKSVGIKKKTGDDLHVMWRLPFEPGTLKAVSRKNGKVVLIKEIKTAGATAKIELTADRKTITADGKDLSFITVKVLDKDGTLVPNADNRIKFTVTGGSLAAVDNGDPVSHDSFRADNMKAFHGLALAVIRGRETPGRVTVTATTAGLKPVVVELNAK
ncbi:beta-galactosidase [Mucilaginibacter phyllosphaerae]|nr:beta-galactosidase [Mucilaginibacter phyllosphaerae]